MPWKESSAMDQRLLLVADYHRLAFSVAELCRRFAISRPTAYKWLARYEAEGPEAIAAYRNPPDFSPQLLLREKGALVTPTARLKRR